MRLFPALKSILPLLIKSSDISSRGVLKSKSIHHPLRQKEPNLFGCYTSQPDYKQIKARLPQRLLIPEFL